MLAKTAKRYVLEFVLIISLIFLSGPGLWSERIVTSKKVGPGCIFFQMIDSDIPLCAYVLKIDLKNQTIRIKSVLGQDNFKGLETVLSMSQRFDKTGHKIIGGINGDFYVGTTPVGIGVIDGQLTKTSFNRSTIIFEKNNIPRINIFSVRMDLLGSKGFELKIDALNNPAGKPDLILYTDIFGGRTQEVTNRLFLILNPGGETVSSHGSFDVSYTGEYPLSRNIPIPKGKFILAAKENLLDQLERIKKEKKLTLHVSTSPSSERIYTAVSGGPQIISQGRIKVEPGKEGFRKGFSSERHPRTAVGYTEDRRFLIMMVVDGRRPDYSRGVDLFELGELLLEYECYDAINLDGGGSSTMVINNEVVNQPSDFTGPRAVANCLLAASLVPEEK